MARAPKAPTTDEQLNAGHEYRVLSLHAWWAWAVIYGGKDVENRDWVTNYRGRLLIHASSKKLGAVSLDEVRHELAHCSGLALRDVPEDFPRSTLIGSVELVDCATNVRSPWAGGAAYQWVLRDPRPLTKPVANVNGTQKIWRWTAPGATLTAAAAPPVTQVNAPRTATSSAPVAAEGSRSIEDLDPAELLAALRKVAPAEPANEVDVLRAASKELGFARMGARVHDGLKGMLRTAVKRRILARDGKELRAGARSLDDYDVDTQIAALVASLSRGSAIERAELASAGARHFGFNTSARSDTLMRAIDEMIRRGLLVAETSTLVRRVA